MSAADLIREAARAQNSMFSEDHLEREFQLLLEGQKPVVPRTENVLRVHEANKKDATTKMKRGFENMKPIGGFDMKNEGNQYSFIADVYVCRGTLLRAIGTHVNDEWASKAAKKILAKHAAQFDHSRMHNCWGLIRYSPFSPAETDDWVAACSEYTRTLRE